MRALISDIHSNLEALTAVLKDIESQGITEIYCLGDVVGYGPNPIECVNLIREKCKVCLCGNHDLAVVTNLPFGFHEAAKKAVDWTHRIMKPWQLSLPSTKSRWNFLKDITENKTKHVEGDLLYVHASPRDPVMEYLEEADCEDIGLGMSGKLEESLSLVKWLCFIGHTHRPGIITEEGNFLKPDDLEMPFKLEKMKHIINIGSVGQPRDKNPQSCYLILNNDSDEFTITYRRVSYDFEETARKIRENPDLDDRMADRLSTGS